MKSLKPIFEACEDADRRGELINFLLYLNGRTRRLKLESILLELHNSGNVSLVSEENLAAIRILENNKFWSLMNIVCKTIPRLDCSHQEIVKLVKILTDKAGADGAANMPNVALIEWCRVNPEKASSIVSDAINLDSNCLSTCHLAVQGLEDTTLALTLFSLEDRHLKVAGLNALGSIDICSLLEVKNVIDNCIDGFVSCCDENLKLSIIETLFRIWERNPKARNYKQNHFVDNFICGSDTDLVHLSLMLSFYEASLSKRNIGKVLKELAGEAPDPARVLLNLDQALFRVDNRWSINDVLTVFSAQILTLDSQLDVENLANFQKLIFSDDNHVSRIFSAWLCSGDFRLCSFLVEILKDRDLTINIFRDDLPSDADDQIFMIRKCVGFLWFHQIPAASVLLSVVKNGKKTARAEAENLLFQPLLQCYGGKLRDFLLEQRKSSSKRISQCTTRALKKHDLYIKGLDKAKHLTELTPSVENRRSALIKGRERNREIQNLAQQKSILSQICTTQTMLYGKHSFSMIRDASGVRSSNISPLNEFSYSTEIPRLSIVDPIGFTQLLAVFRAEQRLTK